MAERTLSASVISAISAGTIRPFLLAEIEYVSSGVSGFLRLFTGVGSLSWNGFTWTGGRDLLAIAPVRESISLEAIGFSITVSGLPADKLALVLANMQKNRSGKVWLGFLAPVAYLSLPGTAGNYASTPDSAANSITGDIDIRARIAPVDWTPSVNNEIIWKSTPSAVTQFAYFFRLSVGGVLQFYWSEDGVTLKNADSTVVTGIVDGAVKWLRVTFDVNNGAAGNDVTFYTSDDGAVWTQLGATVTTAGVTSIFDSNQDLNVGREFGGAFVGKIYYAEVRNGIGGTVVAKFDARRFSSTSLTATMETGEVWTVNQSGSPAAVIVPLPDEVIADPYLLRRGRFSCIPISRDGDTMTVQAQYEGPLARLLTANERRYTHEDQQLRSPGDKGFDQVAELVDAQDMWGSPVPAPVTGTIDFRARRW